MKVFESVSYLSGSSRNEQKRKPTGLKWTGSTVISASQKKGRSLLCPAVATSAVKHALSLSSAACVGPAAVTCLSQMRLMKPQEKVFFRDPVKLIRSRLEHISQIVRFQLMQMERVTAHYKQKSVELEGRLKEVTEKAYSTQRMSLPVAIASPVIPLSRPTGNLGPAERQGWARDRGPSLSSLTTPGSAASISSRSSFHEHRTATSLSTSTRTQRQTPNVFPFQVMSGLSIQSPRH
uniref:RING finger protein 212B-like isoform X4 n=1 Tax=Scatophagus argus TaxID=75038 RepID=UPI001ED83B48|nr:RING finger protein 212B-like isoform X4 [Scatophagus argus]